jgi:hypothetical protein
MIKAKYIGEDDIDIRNGEIYEVCEVKDDNRYFGVKDRSGELYAYPKSLFEIVKG